MRNEPTQIFADKRGGENPLNPSRRKFRNRTTDRIMADPTRCLLDDDEVAEIKEWRRSGFTYAEIAAAYKVSRNTVRRACLPDDPLRKRERREVRNQKILQEWCEGDSYPEIGRRHGISRSTVRQVLDNHV